MPAELAPPVGEPDALDVGVQHGAAVAGAGSVAPRAPGRPHVDGGAVTAGRQDREQDQQGDEHGPQAPQPREQMRAAAAATCDPCARVRAAERSRNPPLARDQAVRVRYRAGTRLRARSRRVR